MKPSADDNATRREARYYESAADGGAACLLCPHGCHLAEGQRGLCRGRTCRGGRLWADGYGRVCALAVDPVEKKPLLHFLPGSTCLSLAVAGCNLSCLNCQNHGLSQAAPEDVPWRYVAPDDLPRLAEASGCGAVAYTYTEPLTWIEYTTDCARACRGAGLKNILVTAGFANERPLRDLLPYIDAANVDLKSFSDAIYNKVSHGRLAPVLQTLCLMRDAGVWVEVTNLVIPGVNDSPTMVEAMCRWLAANGFARSPLHFSRFFPHHLMATLPPTPVRTLVEARRVAEACGMKHVYIGNVSLPGAEDTRCPSCGRLLVSRHGYNVHLGTFSGTCPNCGEPIAGVWQER